MAIISIIATNNQRGKSMSKKGKKSHINEHGRGEIKHSYLAALVTSKVFRTQVVKAKKGKGSFKRKVKHQGQEPYLITV